MGVHIPMLLGELEQLILLATLRLSERARAIDIRALLNEETGQDFSRGSIYAALSRLTEKGFLSWYTEDAVPDRGGIPRRRFEVTPAGLEAIRDARQMIVRLSQGLDELLAEG